MSILALVDTAGWNLQMNAAFQILHKLPANSRGTTHSERTSEPYFVLHCGIVLSVYLGHRVRYPQLFLSHISWHPYGA
jgi:hypothetical protein